MTALWKKKLKASKSKRYDRKYFHKYFKNLDEQNVIAIANEKFTFVDN